MVPLSRTARLCAALVTLVALMAYGFRTYTEMLEHPERTAFDILWRQARYFTYLTSVLVAGAFARFALFGRASVTAAAGLMLWSASVGGVYHVLLARDLTGLAFWSDHGLHTALPLAVILWWIACAPKAGLRPRDAARWLIWPGLYALYALIRGAVDGRHPYVFLDPPLIGWPLVGLYSGALALAFWGAGLVLVRLTQDRPTQAHPTQAHPTRTALTKPRRASLRSSRHQ